MAHSLHHAESSARKFGGTPADYLPIHNWFDSTKQYLALPGHRALRHHASGIWEAERVFGVAITNSSGRIVPVRFIGEQHVREDCRCIPTVAHWLKNLPIEPWMVNGVILPDIEVDPETATMDQWRMAVAEGKTILGFAEWIESHKRCGFAA